MVEGGRYGSTSKDICQLVILYLATIALFNKTLLITPSIFKVVMQNLRSALAISPLLPQGFIVFFNPFVPNAPFLYAMVVFKGWRKGALGTNGLRSFSCLPKGCSAVGGSRYF